jgi:hypothetical protein
MRTKTLLLSALLGALGSVSIHAQTTNVYSLNAVGYINVVLQPGFNIVSVPLLTSPDNTIATVFNNMTGAFTGNDVYFYVPSTGLYSSDAAVTVGSGRGQTTNGWANLGTNVASPGVGFWFENKTGVTITNTFVGTVPTGPITNVLGAGFNLVGSAVPTSGDIVSNTISMFTNYNIGDNIYTYNPLNPPSTAYTEYSIVPSSGRGSGSGYNNNWTPGDAVVPNVGEGFWYENKAGTTVNWVENYSVSQ